MKLIQVTLSIVIVVTLSLGSVGLADNGDRTTNQTTDDAGEISTAAAIALTIEAYRQIQGAIIEADFQNDLRASAPSPDLARLAIKRREARLRKLTGQLKNMETAHAASVAPETDLAPSPLDMDNAAANLSSIAASSLSSDLDPRKRMLVTAILQPESVATNLVVAFRNIHSYSSLAAWIVTGIRTAQQAEVNYSGLLLLAVTFMIVIHRISQLAGMAGSQGLLRKK